jgi:hypothetical protein
MSSKIETMRDLLVDMTHNQHKKVAAFMPYIAGLLRAAPVVERQPVAYEKPNSANYYGHSNAYIDWQYSKDTMALVEHLESVIDAVPDGPLYTAPPELAELQSMRRLAEDSCNELVSRCLEHADTVAELQATIAQLETKLNNAINLDFERRAEIERLKGGQGEAVAMMIDGREGEPCVWFSRPPNGTKLFASQPAPVAVPKGWKLVPEVATLEMKNAGWQECERQGVDPESIEMQTIWTAMQMSSPNTRPSHANAPADSGTHPHNDGLDDYRGSKK